MPKFIFFYILTGWHAIRNSTSDSEGGASPSVSNAYQDLPAPTEESAAATSPRTTDEAGTKDGKLVCNKDTY